MKLKTKLISGVAILSIFIILVCSLFTYISVRNFSNNVDELTAGLSKDVERDVGGFSNHYAGTLIHLEGKNMVEKLDSIVNSIESSLSASKNISNQTIQRNLFESYVNENPYLASMYIANNNGVLTAYPQSITKQEIDEWYQKAKDLDNGQYFISNMQQDEIGNQYITISTPVYQNNNFFGVISADLDILKLSEQISEVKVGNTGSITLIDKENTILGYQDITLVKEGKNIEDLPFFKSINDDGKILLDIEQVTYLPLVHEKTGWTVFSVIPQEEVKSFTQTIGTNMSTKIAQANEATSANLAKLVTIQIIVVIVLVAISIVLSWVISRYFVNPINSVSILMESVANGDLSRKLNVKSKDEIGMLLMSVNKTIDSLRDMVNKINTLAHEVNESSTVLNEQAEVTNNVSKIVNEAMGEVSRGAEQLSSDMFSVSNNVEQNANSIQKMSESISTIANHARETKGVSREGKTAMEKMKTNMELIVKQSVESSTIMKTLDTRLQQISEITKLIHDIAEQTNLLSLNASIEAARAGEHGKGFAVVAQEVKKLAEQSSRSVEEVSELIAEIQNDSTKALLNMEHSKRSVEEGATVVNDSERSFQKIVKFIDDLTNNIEDIAATSDEISQRSTEIFNSIERVSSVSQSTTAGVEEVTGTTDEQMVAVHKVKDISIRLTELTSELKQSVGRFRL
ncbi:methyl-accepting chemotaxis protein [Calidifontibacillus oryziterrae]|uniref:methyl-accepting chemotaxis protein n=1 Tax=Calidifontibacillus oryziterrae TaxID=1191699 RepID=UPI0002DBFF58|nr:methyl-accepting chemotaxis protein [Calidifontibacillus oryziterrae]